MIIPKPMKIMPKYVYGTERTAWMGNAKFSQTERASRMRKYVCPSAIETAF
jgi:hypothetical protein